MNSFKIFTQSDISGYIKHRVGETKIGEKFNFLPHNATLNKDSLKKIASPFVLIGIPEDIGVRANNGIGGTYTTWPSFLKSFLNLQENSFLSGTAILLLGQFELPKLPNANLNELRNAVLKIDDLVFSLVETIAAAGKIPLVIGGGHNNAYPIIKGLSLAKNIALKVVNIDAHADLRSVDEGRHSGNGFSAAVLNGYLDQYLIFGLHQNYVSQAQLDFSTQNKAIKALYFDDLLKNNQSVSKSFKTFVKGLKQPCGLEIDLDSIEGMLASAATPSGFTLNEVRTCLLNLTNCFSYLHVCEGASKLADHRTDEQVGKAVAYLVSDFIKNQAKIYSSSSS